MYPRSFLIHLTELSRTYLQAISGRKENYLWCILDSHMAIVAQEYGSQTRWTMTRKKLELNLTKFDEVMRVRRMNGMSLLCGDAGVQGRLAVSKTDACLL